MGAVNRQLVVVVDDDHNALDSTRRVLRSAGHAVATCDDPSRAQQLIRDEPVALVILDLHMPTLAGDVLLERIHTEMPELPVMMLTAEYDARIAVRCMKLGAVDYLVKPLDRQQLLAAVARALSESALRFEARQLRASFFRGELQKPDSFDHIVTRDPEMLRVFSYLEAVARSSEPILITGETGVGKELVARAAHAVSRPDEPFVAVNVAGLDDAMFSDALFGHAAGAFTGAVGPRDGLVLQAGRGTLFLDEVGDLAPTSQVKLLRLLQERVFTPLGVDSTQPMHARILAATHRNAGELRSDLYYRLRAYHVAIPPLRDRQGDLPLLVERFLEEAAADLGKTKPSVPPELYALLGSYHFPGNVRELRAIVFDAVAQHTRGVMSLRAFADAVGAPPSDAAEPTSEVMAFPHPMPTMKQLERAAVLEALSRSKGNQSAAARLLGVSRPTVARHRASAEDDA